MEIKLVIGLGNPDPQYQNTYHNVGYLFIDYLDRIEKQQQFISSRTLFLKSKAYMNESGRFVALELKRTAINPKNLLIVQDDSDIKLGKYKFTEPEHSAAGHHGIESVQQHIGNKFWRLRIGIRPAAEKIRQKAEKFVLKKISANDKKTLERVFEEVLKTLQLSQ